MALPILAALVAGKTIASKLMASPPPEQSIEIQNPATTTNDSSTGNRSAVEQIPQSNVEVLPPAQESAIQPALGIFQNILNVLETIKNDTSTVIRSMINQEKQDELMAKQAQAIGAESRIEDEREIDEKDVEGSVVTIKEKLKKGFGLLAKTIGFLFAADVIRKLFKNLFPDTYDAIVKSVPVQSIKRIAGGLVDAIAGVFDIATGIVQLDSEKIKTGVTEVNTGSAKILDGLFNPILLAFEMFKPADAERSQDLFQKGLDKYNNWAINIEKSISEAFTIDPKVKEQLSFENIGEEISQLGTSMLEGIKQTLINIKEFFSFSNIKRIITGAEKTDDQKIADIEGKKFEGNARDDVIKQMTDKGELTKESEDSLLGIGNKEYDDLTPEEQTRVDEQVKIIREKAIREVIENPNLETSSMSDGNVVGSIESVPTKDPGTKITGASLRNNGADPKVVAMVKNTSPINAPAVSTDNSSTTINNNSSVVNNGGNSSGPIGTRNQDLIANHSYAV